MIDSHLSHLISDALGYQPTREQLSAISTTARFLTDRREHSVMILRGAAGTGKTTLAAAIVRTLTQLKLHIVLMAPTGRAAKVFSMYSGHKAYTIHRQIYRQKTAGDLSMFTLAPNLRSDTLFIVDEASMIADESSNRMFGSGSLLDDLITYVYGGTRCRLMLIGDAAQLPPVGQELSPALSAEVLAAYGLHVVEATLSEVLRQSVLSGILWNATMVRQMLLSYERTDCTTAITMPRVRLKGFADIVCVQGDELIETLASSYSRAGMDETIVLTRSNKRAVVYNEGIRRTILDREDELCRGDQLMVVKNNYYWMARQNAQAAAPQEKSHEEQTMPASQNDFIANGDMCVVGRVRRVRELYGFRFADVVITFPDYDDLELDATVILDTLTTEAPALTREQQELLYNNVLADYADIPHKADRIKKLKDDVHYNALQVKFGYAVTCHKAQGGQWAHVYVDQGYMTDDMLTPDYFHWLYTAFTRATERLYLVNWRSIEE